ncbi:mitochondrial carrier domain-containing protein [Xylariales sp. AK1849]|nr:mitochondrial carrier domain-containing protein [Xylariales sp. AK1849]
MSVPATVKEAVKDSLLGTDEPSEVSANNKAQFTSTAVKDPETGELYMTEETFINAIAPENLDYGKIKREQFGLLFRVADRKGTGKVTLSDWAAFNNLLIKADAEYEIAFRLFDVERTGSVKYENFRRLYEMNKGPESIPFDWESQWAKLYIGDKTRRHTLTYHEFSQMLRGLQGERIRQAFLVFDKDGDGYIEPEDFERIIRETSKHKLSDHLLENLSTLCNISLGSRVSYANVRAFQNMIKEMDLVELIIRKACQKTPDGKITKAEFLNEAAKITRFSLFTPMEADILFHFASLDEPSGRLSLMDFAKVLDPSWRNRGYADEAGAGLSHAKSTTQAALRQVAESAYHFALGSFAGAFGAFIVYPIDLVKTRMQNQRGANPGQRLYKNSIDCFKKVIANEGVKGLYSGVLPQLVGVAPEKAIKLTVNDLVRNNFTDKKTGQIWWPHELLAGGSAGACQVVFTNPLEIVKIRLQVQGEAAKAGAERRSAMWIVKNLGLAGLYKGASACLLRDVPFSAIYFPTYSHLKRDLFGESQTKKLGILQLLTAGAIAGMPAAYLTTPCDVIKTRLQVEARKGDTNYNGLRHAAQTIWKEEGFRAFFKGGPARVLRSSPQFGVTLATYEVLQSLFPFPGSKKTEQVHTGIAEVVSTVKEKDIASPHARSRNALKIILDLDEDFGRVKIPNQKAWKSMPAILGGGGSKA